MGGDRSGVAFAGQRSFILQGRQPDVGTGDRRVACRPRLARIAPQGGAIVSVKGDPTAILTDPAGKRQQTRAVIRREDRESDEREKQQVRLPRPLAGLGATGLREHGPRRAGLAPVGEAALAVGVGDDRVKPRLPRRVA